MGLPVSLLSSHWLEATQEKHHLGSSAVSFAACSVGPRRILLASESEVTVDAVAKKGFSGEETLGPRSWCSGAKRMGKSKCKTSKAGNSTQCFRSRASEDA